MIDHYKVLGVPRDASPELIKKTYTALQKIYHPDVYMGDKNYAKKKKANMGEIVETTKKKQYNKHLDDNPHEDPRIPEGPEPDVGMDEFGNLVDDYGEIID